MAQNNTVLGVLAHVDAGKTTLSEQLLYRGGVLRSPGRVDEQSAYLDHAGVERRRGITVFSDQADLRLGGRPFTLVDTPGHTDFSGEMERTLSILDCAVLVVSAAEGVQAHTETLWRLLADRHLPVIVFLNKMDRAGADPCRVLEELERLGGRRFLDMTEGLSEAGISPELWEGLAELDDSLLEGFFAGTLTETLCLERAKALLASRKLFPLFSGSALKGQGIEGFLLGLKLLAPASPGDPGAPFSGRVFQVRHDKSGRVVFLKVEQGTLRPKDLLETREGQEKCNELRRYSGAKYDLLKEAGPGAVCAITGIREAKAGEPVGHRAKEASQQETSLRPLLAAKVLYDAAVPPPAALARFRELEDEEPLLGVAWNEEKQEIEVQVMGEIQLEVLQELARERWGMEIAFGPCSVLYAETLAAPVLGVGHFEPLRHYAEVHLGMRPGARGSGIVFSSQCHQDELSQNWQSLIRTHVLEKRHRGVLVGAPLTDVEIVLLSGRAHLKHTEGGDFRQATYRAIRQGLMAGSSVLLEPYYDFEAEVAPEEAGRVQADMLRLGGQCQAPEEAAGRARLRGRGPVRTLMGYPREFTALTKGRGRIAFRFGGYEPCRDQEAIVEQAGYEPERDLENTPDSVFCSHGAGFPVKWTEAPAHMHLPLEHW